MGKYIEHRGNCPANKIAENVLMLEVHYECEQGRNDEYIDVAKVWQTMGEPDRLKFNRYCEHCGEKVGGHFTSVVRWLVTKK